MRLDKYLSALTPYWQFEAFHCADYPWAANNPLLCDFLEALSEQQLHLYQQNPEKLYPLLVVFIPTLLILSDSLFAVEQLNAQPQTEPFWLSTGIKGRKWQQIRLFSEQLDNKQPFVEWCAGKGHLGRLVSWQNNLPVTSIEWQQTLCESGAAQAKQQQIAQHFIQADVLKGQADHCIDADQHAIALHACGDLHLQLINLAKQHKPQQLSISPCCYHLTEQSIYLACSKQGQQSALILKKEHLKLAVNKQVTSGKRQSRLSEMEVLWRLAFDELQKHYLQSEQYLPLPSFPKKLLSSEFKDFVHWAMLEKSLHFPVADELQPFIQLAEARLKKVRRMELLSQFFVRPLELWLVHDRLLSLQESGYQVRLSCFCEEQITPRNLLIQARLKEINKDA